MKNLLPAMLILCGAASVNAAAVNEPLTVRTEIERQNGPLQLWSSTPPDDCPFPQSPQWGGLALTGRHATYTHADTWYPMWGADDRLYSPFTDGKVGTVLSVSDEENAPQGITVTGHAVIEGADPLDLKFLSAGTWPGPAAPYAGRYPCGNLVHGGVWFIGTYCLYPETRVEYQGHAYNWPWLGPFVGFRWSTDGGATWNDPPWTPEKPLFGERVQYGMPVRIGAPHFVDFGRDMTLSPDGKAYLVAHGASVPDAHERFANHSWITGDQVYLLRVDPTVEAINDPAAWEFFAGNDAQGAARWTHDFQAIRPLLEWNNNMGCVTVTRNEALGRYLMCVTDGGRTSDYFNTYVLESEQLNGPWRLVTYLRHFGEQAYFVNIPSRFISDDGQRFWLCYSANFGKNWSGIDFKSLPPGSGYGMCLQEVTLTAPDEVRRMTEEGRVMTPPFLPSMNDGKEPKQ